MRRLVLALIGSLALAACSVGGLTGGSDQSRPEDQCLAPQLTGDREKNDGRGSDEAGPGVPKCFEP